MTIKGSRIEIKELTNFQELTTSETSTVLGGAAVASVELSPVAASFLLGEPVSNNATATYEVFFENGKLSDLLTVVPPSPPGTALQVRGKSGIFF